MTIDQWAKFVRSIAGDSGAEAILRGRNAGDIIALAKSKGFSFSEQDLADVKVMRDGELTEDALEQVSGAYGTRLFVGGGVR